MKVLLLNPPFVKNFMRNARWAVVGISGSQWFPIYLAYATGLLEKNGHQAKLVDAQSHTTRSQVFNLAKKFKPELLILYFSTASLKNDIEIGQQIKKITKAKVVMVGPWASINPLQTLKSAKGIDMLAKGEFDFTVLDLANRLPKNKIPGLYYKKNNQIIKNPDRPPVTSEQMAQFPFVTNVYRRHLNINKYHQTGHQHPFVDLFTGRGCQWGLCTFCLWPHTINKGVNPRYRTRTIDSVIDELKFIKKKMPYIKEVFFQDDTLVKDRAIQISKAILKQKLKVCWSCYARPTLDLDTLKLMKKAGCRTMHVGFESGNLEILKNIKKGTTPTLAKKFAQNANKAGLFIVADFITGLPGETVNTIKQTVKWAKKLPVQRYTITLPKPYPQTPFYDYLKKNNYLNSQGEVNYPHLSWEEINKWNRWSIKQVYLNPYFFLRMVTKPYEWARLIRSAAFFFPYLFSKNKQTQYAGMLEIDTPPLDSTWENYWQNYTGVTGFGVWSQQKSLSLALNLIKDQKLTKTSKILDLGCGEGRTLLSFFKTGYKNSIGIDKSPSSIKICQKKGLIKGKNIFLDDALKTRYKSNSFDLVFSEGLLEHFDDPTPIIQEMARLSKKHILIIQPNHFSLFGQAISILGHFLRNNVKEKTFSKKYFINKFSQQNFILKKQKDTPFREFFIMLFSQK